MTKYIYSVIKTDNAENQKKTSVYSENRLESHPHPLCFENTLSHEENESRHVAALECSFIRCPEGYCVDVTRNQSFTVFYASRGSFQYNDISMSKGDAVFVEPYFEYTLSCREDCSEIYRISWEGDITVHIAQMLRNFVSDSVYNVGCHESVTALIDSMIYNRFLERVSIKQLAVGFTDMLLAYLTRATGTDNLEKKPADLIARAKGIIEASYTGITVEQLANALYVNSKYLSKAFRKHTGMTPKHYITETKMTHAEHYLINTEYPIQKISEIVGYNNYTNFYIAFKTKYGIAPEEYRKMFSEQDSVHKKSSP